MTGSFAKQNRVKVKPQMRRMLINADARERVYTIPRSGYIQFNRGVIRLREFDNGVGVEQNTFDWILRFSLSDLMYMRVHMYRVSRI